MSKDKLIDILDFMASSNHQPIAASRVPCVCVCVAYQVMCVCGVSSDVCVCGVSSDMCVLFPSLVCDLHRAEGYQQEETHDH